MGEIYHLFYEHDVVSDEINNIAMWSGSIVIIYRDIGVIFGPAPILFPRQIIPYKAAVGLSRKCIMQQLEFTIILIYPEDIAR